MSELVERVAKAIADCNGHDWEHYCDEASATIAAMREPTPEMLNAGTAIIAEYFGERSYSTGVNTAREVWYDMIDAALAETETVTK
jgi:hypothetical protein